MRKFDFAIQTTLMSAALALGVTALLYGSEYLVFLLVVQFLMGVWQLLSAFATTANRNHGNEIRTKIIRIYWMLVVAYFAVLILLYSTADKDAAWQSTAIWLHMAWLIAIYYYAFTIRLAFGVPRRKTFFDVVN